MVHTMKSERVVSEPTRRHHDRLFKAGLVQQSLQPGASVAAIALQNGVNANLLFRWRRDHLRATPSTSTERAVLLPVHASSLRSNHCQAVDTTPCIGQAGRANSPLQGSERADLRCNAHFGDARCTGIGRISLPN